jgi:hypothetical protein
VIYEIPQPRPIKRSHGCAEWSSLVMLDDEPLLGYYLTAASIICASASPTHA